MATQTRKGASRLARPVAVGVGTFAISAALFSAGIGIAAADELKPVPGWPGTGPTFDDQIRAPGIQGQLRASNLGVAQAQGEVRGPSGIGIPSTRNMFQAPDLAGDLSACTGNGGPWCSHWLAPVENPNSP